MRNLFLMLIVFAFLLVQTSLATVLSVALFTPNLLLPMAIQLGVSPDIPVVRGAALAFVGGYLLDSFSGTGLGLQTFLLVGTFLIARFAGLRFLMRGVFLQVALTFVVGVVLGGASLALRAIFEPPPPFPLDSVWEPTARVLLSSASTAALAPLLFSLVQRVEGISIVRREERA